MELKEKKSIIRTFDKLKECVVEFQDISDDLKKDEKCEHYGQMLDIGARVLIGVYAGLSDIFDSARMKK